MSSRALAPTQKAATTTVTPAAGFILQRQCACGQHSLGGECEECKKKQMSLQRKSDNGSAFDTVPPIVHEVLRSPGLPLDCETRAFMEPRFGHDFSHVRVHTDARAAESARAVNALAYTVERDLVFAAGQYAPHSISGRKLVAHELTHVVQQANGSVSGRPIPGSIRLSAQGDPFERQASQVAARLVNDTSPDVDAGRVLPLNAAAHKSIQRQVTEASASAGNESVTPPITWASGPAFGSPIELPLEEAARRVNRALDLMGSGLTYVRRPPASSEPVASAEVTGPSPTATIATLQAFPDISIQRAAGDSSSLAKVHGGVVGSIQVCWDCLSGEGSFKGWLWAGVGYDAPVFGWIGGYYFDEKTWWKGDLGKWFEPGTCDPKCEPKKEGASEGGWGIAGFPVDIKPKQRTRLSKAGLEIGFLLTPHSFCDADLELIALLNILGYLGPIATVATKAIDGLNTITRDSPHFALEAGIDVSATFHLCRGENSLLAVNRAEFCGGGYVGAGVGLSHTKEENHGAG